MNDLEDLLRAYGRTADAEVGPVEIDEIRRDRPPIAPSIEPIHGRSSRNGWRVGGLVAASVIALVAVAAVTRGGSSGVTDDPGSTDGELTELPAPGPATLTIEATSVGTISWRRIVGTDTELPELITGTDESGALLGRDRDPSITWRSTDRGLTWERAAGDGTRATINGVEWISRDDLTDEEPAVLSFDDGSGERKLPLPDIGLEVPAPFVVDGQIGTWGDGLPYSIGDRTILAAYYEMHPDWAAVTGVDDWSSIEIRSDRQSWFTSRDDQTGPAFTYELRETADGATLVDSAGDTALSVDAVIDGLDGFDASMLISGGQATTRLFEFVDGRVRPIATPWPAGQRVIVNEVQGGLLAHRFDPPDSTFDVWHSVDGVAWTAVNLPVDTSVVQGTYINVGIDGELVLIEGRNNSRAWATTNGLTYTEIPAPPSGMRSGGDFGWVTVENYDTPRFQVSPDGADWERVDISPLLDLNTTETFDFLEFRAIDDQILLTSSRGGQRLLLIGDVGGEQPDETTE